MANVWFLSDLHLSHKNICKFRQGFESVEQHDQLIKDNYHKVVTKRDKVFFLGDVAFSKESLADVKTWVAEKKVLIAGNHCFTSGTELLTDQGWKIVESITKDDKVATVDLSSDKVYFTNPTATVVNESSEIYAVKGTWIDEEVSSEHNVVYQKMLKPVNTLVGKHSNERFMLSSNYDQVGLDISHEWIKLLTWVVMDGCIYRSSAVKTRVQFKLSKERKINKLESLLKYMGIPYTKKLCKKTGLNKLQPYYIRIYGQYSREIHSMLADKKELPKTWKGLNKAQTLSLLETICETDGSLSVNKLTWHTTSKSDADTVQLACILNGIGMCISEKINGSGFENSQLQYLCLIDQSGNGFVKTQRCVEISSTGRKASTYGVTMKFGTVISRRNGKVSISGNCTDHHTMKDLCGVFDEVYSLYKYKGMWLSHAPIHPSELRGKLNLHGHTHYVNVDDSRYLNVSMEQIDFTPIDLNGVRKRFSKQLGE